jgi:hypothetical protein
MEVFIRGIVFVPRCIFASLVVLLWGVYGLTYTARPSYRMYKGRIFMAPKAIVIRLCVVVAHVQPLADYLSDRCDLYLRDAVLVNDLQVQPTPGN